MVATRSADHPPTPRVKRHRYQRPRRAQAKTYPVEDSNESSNEDDEPDDSSSDQDVPDLETDGGTNTDDELSAPSASLTIQGPRRSARRSSIAVAPKGRFAKRLTTLESTAQRPNRSPQKSQTASPAKPVRQPAAKPASNQSSPLKRRHAQAEDEGCLKDPGVIPNWLSPAIPYSAWVDIFTYAARDGQIDPSPRWLKHAATTCRTFAEPALAALYDNPVIGTATKARRLVSTLERDPAATFINYRSKVHSLLLDTSALPQSLFAQLIFPLPWLKELIIFHPYDQPPYRGLDKTVRWSYPTDIFRALEAAPDGQGGMNKPTGANLQSWEWSARLLHGPISDIARLHQLPALAGLTRLSFTNFQVPSLNQPPPREGDIAAAMAQELADGAVIEAVANAILELKHLKHLVFESSTVMNDKLLPLLPHGLTHIDLINCWEIKSDDLTSFLRTHGHELKVLNLMHNQSLNLAFLTDLADTCPKLHELRMNLSYYRHHESVDDGDPMYDTALNPGQTPQWPPSLRLIDFEHIRDWSYDAANDFLQSLIDQAEILPDLRHLVIKTILDIPWQQRATMRMEWRQKMDKVFLRPYRAPLHRPSLRPKPPAPEGDATGDDSASPRKRQRRSSPPSRRSGRLAEQDSQRDELDDGIEVPFVQGKCKTVSVTFDNQKVRELQYGMEDFLMSDDDESEEEWTGDYDDDDGAKIAF